MDTHTEHNWYLYGAVISVNFLSFGTGSAYSWTSPVLPKLRTNTNENPFGRSITYFEESLIVSLVSLGAALGPFLTGFLADRIGRKPTLLLFSLPMIICYLITAFATTVELYYIARFLMGLGSGCVFAIVPMYVGEVAENSNRGFLGCIMSVMLSTAILLVYVVGPYVSIKTLSLLCIFPLVFFLITFGLLVPESPYYYVLKNNQIEARKALTKLRKHESAFIEEELEVIVKNVKDYTKTHKIKNLLKSKSLTKGLTISVGLMFFQQFAGISVILSYMQPIFDATGSSIPPEIATIIIGCIQLVISLVTSQLVDRIGRRVLLLTSMVGVASSTGLLGIYFYFQTIGYNVDWLFWFPLTCLIAFMLAYNFGIGPLAWAMMGELFPPNAKALATTITTFACLMMAFLTTIFFPNFMATFGIATSFWLFSIISTAGIIFVEWVVPETKGKSLQEIQDLLSRKGKDDADDNLL